MKVSELFEALKTPPEYTEEWDHAIPKKIREIAKKCDLTATISGGSLQKNKKFAGKSFRISLVKRGIGKYDRHRISLQHFKENPKAYESFWKAIYDAFHGKYEITAPIGLSVSSSASAAKEFTPKTYNGRYGKIMLHMKGINNVDQKKIESNLIKKISEILSAATPDNIRNWNEKGLETLEKQFNDNLATIRRTLAAEREAGRTYPEVEKLLDPKAWPEIIRTGKLAHYSKELRKALKGGGQPYMLDNVIRAIKNARAGGHHMSELEKILPEKHFNETRKKHWETYLIQQVISAIERNDAGGISYAEKELSRLEGEGHKFPEVHKLLDKKAMPAKFWEVVTKKEHPADTDVVKYILANYKQYPSGEQVKTLMDLARKAGHNSEEFKAIQRSLDHTS